jgi:hypothetical protein
MKYRHLFNGLEHEAPAGSLNWPWMPAEPREDHPATRQRARDHVAATVAEATAPKRGPGRPRKDPEGSPDA